MKTLELLTENTGRSMRHTVQRIWDNIQDSLVELEDELLDMTDDPQNVQIAEQAIQALRSGDYKTLHQIIRKLH